MFWGALLFFHNIWCWKRNSNTCCIIYGCYTLLQTFFNFLIIKKTGKTRNNPQDHLISSTILKSSNLKKGKGNFLRFWIRPGQTNFCTGWKVSKEWKENFRIPQESFEKSSLSWDLTFRKAKDFWIQFHWKNKWPQHYITLQMKVVCLKCQILLVSGNREFRKLSGVFCFYFRNIFPCVCLTKQHKYFANKKSCKTSAVTKTRNQK